jgi:hypothetical protein
VCLQSINYEKNNIIVTIVLFRKSLLYATTVQVFYYFTGLKTELSTNEVFAACRQTAMATSQGGQTSRPIFVHNNYSQPKNNKLAQFVVILVQAPKLYCF